MLNRRQAACTDTRMDVSRVKAQFKYVITRLKGQQAHNVKMEEHLLAIEAALDAFDSFLQLEEEDTRESAEPDTTT